jgi:hypothetical protein
MIFTVFAANGCAARDPVVGKFKATADDGGLEAGDERRRGGEGSGFVGGAKLRE